MENIIGKIVDKLVDNTVEKFTDSRLETGNLQSLKRKWQALESRAADFEEEVSRAELSGKKKRKKEVGNWLKEVEKIKFELEELYKCAGKGSLRNLFNGGGVKDMEKRVVELMEQSQHFNGLLLDDHGNKGEPRLTTKLFGKMFKQNLERIRKWLVTDGISNIGVYGMGGVGKTTLVKHIHNHLLEKTNFRVSWFTVSEEFNWERLQKQVANAIGLDLSEEEDEEIKASKLYRILKRTKNLVIILDDVWEAFCFKSVGIPLGANGCKVILTTRSLQICDQLDCERKLEVNPLNMEEAWELFKHVLGHRTILHTDTEKIAKSITERCAGLPLGIITMAGSMKGTKDICQWRDTLQQLKSYSKGNGNMECKVFSVLGWSFNRLNKCQQNCFLYCSLYPEDQEIPKKELINLFILAGLLDGRETRKQEFDQGHKVLNELVSACLLEETAGSGDCVKMHDLIRDMAIRITCGEYIETMSGDKPRFMVKAGVTLKEMPEQKEWAKDLDVVSLMGNRIPKMWPNLSPNCPKLSVLILSGCPFGLKSPIQNCIWNRISRLKSIPSSFFAHMTMSLRVLDLSYTAIKELPSCVSNMENLTALLLRGCTNLQFVPPLGMLKELRELNISRTRLQNLPQGVEMLVNLRCLYIDATMIKIIPEGTLVGPSHLQYLWDVKALKGLEEFKGALLNMDAYNQLVRSQQSHRRLNSYCISVNESSGADHIFEYDEKYEEENLLFLEHCRIGDAGGVEPDVLLPPDIRELRIYSCSGTASCLSDIFPQLNSSISLIKCQIEDSFEQLEFLLRLSSTSDQQESCCSLLHSLEVLSLYDLPNFVGLIKWGVSGVSQCLPCGTFSGLRYFTIVDCNKITKLLTPQLLKNLQNLESLYVDACAKLEEIIAEDEIEGLELTFDTTVTAVLPKLKQFLLYNLQKLKSICRGTMICDTISNIRVWNCPKLKKLPLSLPTVDGRLCCPKNLMGIYGREEWWESLDWDDPSAKIALQSKFKTPVRKPT